MEIPTVEEYFRRLYDLPHGIDINVPDEVAETYYDFFSLALQLSESGFEIAGAYPEYHGYGNNKYFESCLYEGDRRIYVRAGVKDGKPYRNIGARNYKWPGAYTTIRSSEDAQRIIRQVEYGPDVVNNILNLLNSPDGRALPV